MFVSQSTYKRLERELTEAVSVIRHLTSNLEAHKIAFKRVTGNWNELVERINAKGGEDFLDNAVLNPPSQFTQEDVNRLIRLCHPDRHNNSDVSNEITKKLLQLRDTLK
jgi:hypothetical protein